MAQYVHCSRCAFAHEASLKACPRCVRHSVAAVQSFMPAPANVSGATSEAQFVRSVSRPPRGTPLPGSIALASGNSDSSAWVSGAYGANARVSNARASGVSGANARVARATADLLSALADASPDELEAIVASGLAPTVEDDPWAAVLLHAVVTAARHRQGVQAPAARPISAARNDKSIRAFVFGVVVRVATRAQQALAHAQYFAQRYDGVRR